MKNEGHTDRVGDVAVHPKSRSERQSWVPFCVAIAAFCGIVVVGWIFQSTSLASWQQENLHWNFILHSLMFLVPIVAMVSLRRTASDYGLCVPMWRQGMNIGVAGSAIFIVFVLTGVSIGSLAASQSLMTFPFSTLIYQIFFVAVFEELFFRGFLQHELGRSWRNRGDERCESVNFAWILTAILFGLGHGLTGFNPFRNSYEFATGMFLSTFVLGCVLGLLRARSGSIWPSVLLHLVANVSTPIFMEPTSGAGQVLILLGFFTALPLVAIWCANNQAANQHAVDVDSIEVGTQDNIALDVERRAKN